jgi:glycosyltransferase involved in cell wall biosynthesis
MSLAIVHDYLIQMGGAERVVAAMAETFPTAPIITSVTDTNRLLPEFCGHSITNTWMNGLPGIRKHFKKYFALFPVAFRSLAPVDADLAWISSSGFAKWITLGPNTISICYCHTPPRFLWEPDSYLSYEISNLVLLAIVRRCVSILRKSDYRCAQKIGHFIANSRCVQKRIRKFYLRDSQVIHPPVDVQRFAFETETEDYHLVLSRLVGYKRIDRAVEAFNLLRKRLVIVGEGPDRTRLERLAGPTIQFAGGVSDHEAKRYLERCRGLIFPGREDFGIAPVEAQACGKPVIALAADGALETVIPQETGILFDHPTVESLAEAVQSAERINWAPHRIRKNAERFSKEVFVQKIGEFIKRVSGTEELTTKRQPVNSNLSARHLAAPLLKDRTSFNYRNG